MFYGFLGGTAAGSLLYIEINFTEKEFFMFQKIVIIGMFAACIFSVHAVPADAGIAKYAIKAAQKVRDYVGKTANDAGKVVWNNKGSIAVGTAAAVALTNPDAATAAVNGTADVVTGAVTGTTGAVAQGITTNAKRSTGGSVLLTLLLILLLIVLVILGMRYLLHRVGIWKLAMPLLMIGVLLCCAGVAQAGVVGFVSVADIFAFKPLLDLAMLVIVIISLFL